MAAAAHSSESPEGPDELGIDSSLDGNMASGGRRPQALGSQKAGGRFAGGIVSKLNCAAGVGTLDGHGRGKVGFRFPHKTVGQVVRGNNPVEVALFE
jgi:hypothetical protein